MGLSRANRLLVGIVKTPGDLRIFQEERWYRIPADAFVTRDEESWPPGWLAAFEGVQASRSKQQVIRYAEVTEIRRRTREELFPGLPAGSRAGRKYYQLMLGPIQKLPAALIPPRHRRTTFIETSIAKLHDAKSFNDLFGGGQFEDELWKAFELNFIDAERQWNVLVDRKHYILDFAVFCKLRNIDVEVDGRQHHAMESRSEYDADRDNDLARKGWAVQRFRAAQLTGGLEGCISKVGEAIERYGGLESANFRLVPRPEGVALQLDLLEERAQYGVSEDDEH